MKTKIVILTALCMLFAALFSISSLAYGNSSIPKGQYVIDRDDSISAADESDINEALERAEAASGAKIRAYVYEGFEYYDYLDYIRESEESIDSLVLLVVQYDYYYDEYSYYLDTYGDAHSRITSAEVDRILDNSGVYNNIKSGNLKEGIIAYASLAKKAVVGELRPNFYRVLLTSLVIALIVAVGACAIIFFSYKKKLHSESYPLSRYASLNLKIERDSFVTKFVTRVRIRSSSEGGGGRSSGGRSSGGRRGGR